MKQVIISITALALSQVVVAKEERTVGELLNHGGKAIIETCEDQGFDLVCGELAFVLQKSIVGFCRAITNPGPEDLQKNDI